MSWKLVNRCAIVRVWHLLGVSPWPRERPDLFRSEQRTRSRVFGGAPTEASTDQWARPPWMPSLLRGIITRQRLNYLVLVPVVWRAPFMIEHEFCMAADISKILAIGGVHKLGWAQTFCFIWMLNVWQGELTKGGGPDRRITFHKKQNASPPGDLLNFLFRGWVRLVTRLTQKPSVKGVGGQIHYLGPGTKTLCLAPPEV